jgi:DNA-binding IclR family transcriptional regulator
MRALGANPHGMSLAAIANDVDLARSTVQRIVAALEIENLVEARGASGGFRLGPALGQLIHQTQTDIISSVRSCLTDLSASVQESVSLATLAGDRVHVVDCIIYERELRVVFPIGIDAPAHKTAAGKALLAGMQDSQIRVVLPSFFIESDDMACQKAFAEQIRKIRTEGIACDDGEHVQGVSALAVLLNTYFGQYSISVLAPSERAKQHANLYRSALLSTKELIESKIGRPSPGLESV